MAWIKHEDLGRYLNSTYPEMKFYEKKSMYNQNAVSFVSGISKKYFCEFGVDTIDEEYWDSYKDIWNDRTLVMLGFYSNKKSSGWTVDNRAEMVRGIEYMVKKVKDALGIKTLKMRQLTIEDVLADMERGKNERMQKSDR